MRNIKRNDAREIILRQAQAYHAGNKSQKGEILQNLEAVLGRSRKSLIRTLNTCHKQQKPALVGKKARGRPRCYTKATEVALVEVWEVLNCPCAERLHPQVAEIINILKTNRDWHHLEDATTKLLNMPVGTMRYYLAKIAKDKGLMRGISTTRSSDILNQVPIFHGDWSKQPLGYGQMDTVVHSGERLEGTMVYTLSFIEMQTYWQEYYAQLGKTDEITKHSLSRIAQVFPIDIKGAHSDSGSEFINQVLITWCKKHKIKFTRSRPYEKNDNANVEERNRSIVRKYVGFERYDCQEAVEVMNKLYRILSLYNNHFQPIMKITTKKRLANGYTVRKYATPKTPYQRMLDHPDVPKDVKQRLKAQHATLNPKELLATIQALTTNLERIQKQQGYHF